MDLVSQEYRTTPAPAQPEQAKEEKVSEDLKEAE
jgi:hypothetical protein